ncbi:FG-GAP repeat protein [Marinicella gelatinilytica]|uniref:FG-GAP repeat protein n=1 Tax=Marinicella gelatinilytica TaxID=2996017 RepID=UPI002260D25F|nr:FG-GAP repeat protein [Marinicella gelatinilytica]MCX7545887.1 FG-GAP repeat protein [Marinicella gelatinilytica]
MPLPFALKTFILFLLAGMLSCQAWAFVPQHPDSLSDKNGSSVKAAVEDAKLLPTDGVASQQFAYSVSLSGDRALIGAIGGTGSGSAYVFELQGGSWVETAKLVASDGAVADRFGVSVSLSGDRALIGSYKDDDNGSDSGSAYVFELQGGIWTETAKLTASDGAAYDYFAYSVSLSGDRALIGSYHDDDHGSNSGSAYVFDLQGGSWTETTKLTASDAAGGDQFGVSVSLLGGRALIGSFGDDDHANDAGSAYVFDLQVGGWIETIKLTASDATLKDYFGYAVSLSNNRALIGAYRNDDYGTDSGSAYIFDLQGGSWTETVKLLPDDGQTYDVFGYSVSLSGDRALIGAYGDDDYGNEAGSAYVFNLQGGRWYQTDKLTAGDAASDDLFGYAVSLSGERALIGAYGDDDNGSFSGSAYVFSRLQAYSIGGQVSGLISGNYVTLSINSGDEYLVVNSNGSFSFLNPLTDTSAYQVTVLSNPTTPNQNCAVVNGTGTVQGADVTDIEVNCSISQYFIGGYVHGLIPDNFMRLQNNLTDDLIISQPGAFAFATPLDDQQSYDVSIHTQPNDPMQNCDLINDSGTITGADVNDVFISCEFGDDLIFRHGFDGPDAISRELWAPDDNKQ